jgi:hypothetical protein
MASAIGKLLADPVCARDMGRAGRAAVQSRFTSRHMAEDLADLLYRTIEA